jgi:hypothetical protein
MRVQLLCLYCCLAVPVASLQSQTPAPTIERFLQQSIGLDAAQLAAIERGEPVVKVMDTENRRDVAIFGIMTSPVTRAAYTAQLRDVTASLRAPTRPRFGVFSDPARPADVEALSIAEQDVQDLKGCRPGDCKIKLPATDMQQIQTAATRDQVNAYARRRFLEYIADYRARGNAAMAIYDDRGATHASDAFAALLDQSPYVYQYAPSLHQYLKNYPNAQLPGATETLYWSEDLLPKLRPIVSITHRIVYEPPGLAGVTLVAGKQIYADHYFEAAFELWTVISRADSLGGGSYLILLRRFRFDDMPSGGILNIRGKVIGKLRDQTRVDLVRGR